MAPETARELLVQDSRRREANPMLTVPIGSVLLLGGLWMLVYGWRTSCEASSGLPVGAFLRFGDNSAWWLLGGSLLTIVGGATVIAGPFGMLPWH